MTRGRPKALLVVLHGGGGGPEQMEETTGLTTVADREGFDVVYPEGIGFLGGFGRMWNAGHCCGRPQVFHIDDLHFVRALVVELSARLGVPLDRVFFVGYSNGALLAYEVASQLSGAIGGVVIFAGTMRAHGVREAPDFEVKPPLRPIAMLSVHGTSDRVIPYDGVDDFDGIDVSFEQAGRFWAAGARCRTKPVLAYERGGYVQVGAYGGCAAGADVVQLTLVGWDHEWPGHRGTDDLPAGNPLHGFDLGERIGAFVTYELRARDGVR